MPAVAIVQASTERRLCSNAFQDLPFVALPKANATPAATTAALICCSRRMGLTGRCLLLCRLCRPPCIAEGLSGRESPSVEDASEAVSDKDAVDATDGGGGFTGCDMPYPWLSSANCTEVEERVRPSHGAMYPALGCRQWGRHTHSPDKV